MSYKFCIFLATVFLYSAGVTAKSISALHDEDVPLDLTHFIERGDASTARSLSTVDPDEFAGVHSHAAFITVNKTNKWHTFFWFFPVENKPLDTTPWIIWLQGGPGASSLFGLFNEIGPLQVKNGTVSRMPVTWGSDYSLLFIDNPIGAGFSYSEIADSYMVDEDDVGRGLLSFLEQFVQVFPELQKAPLFIAGESYAGKYVPAIGHYLHNRQDKSIPVNLKALILADGYTDPPSLLHYSDLALQLGFLGPDQAAEAKKEEEEAAQAWKENNEPEYLLHQQKVINDVFPFVPNVYNYVEDFNGFGPNYESFLTKKEVLRAIHTGNISYSGQINDDVIINFTDRKYLTVKPWLEELLEHYKVLCYNGQLDFIVGYALSEHFYYSLNWSGATKYWNAPRIAIHSDNPEYTLNPIGYMKGAGNFWEAMLRSAGHMAPADQPLAAKQLIDMFVQQVMGETT